MDICCLQDDERRSAREIEFVAGLAAEETFGVSESELIGAIVEVLFGKEEQLQHVQNCRFTAVVATQQSTVIPDGNFDI